MASTPIPRPEACTFAPTLYTARLTLTLYSASDDSQTDFLLSMFNDPVTVERMGDFGMHTREQLLAINESTQLLASHTPSHRPAKCDCIYMMRLGGREGDADADTPLIDNQLVGAISLAARHVAVPPDIGWIVQTPFHGHGYATEGACKVRDYLLYEFDGGYLNISPPKKKIGVIAWIKESNRQSLAVAQKLGMVPMGELGSLDDPNLISVVYGLPRSVEEGRMFDRSTRISFFGPGEGGKRVKRLLLGLPDDEVEGGGSSGQD